MRNGCSGMAIDELALQVAFQAPSMAARIASIAKSAATAPPPFEEAGNARRFVPIRAHSVNPA